MYILNNRVPRLEPCGTPIVMSCHLLNLEIIFAPCCRSDR